MKKVTEEDRDRTRKLIAELLNPLLETGSVDDILVFAVMRGDKGNLVTAHSEGKRLLELEMAAAQWIMDSTARPESKRYETPPTVKQ